MDNVEEHIRSLPWSEYATDEQKTLVAGNLRNYARKVEADIQFAAETIAKYKRKSDEAEAEIRILRGHRQILRNALEAASDMLSRACQQLKQEEHE